MKRLDMRRVARVRLFAFLTSLLLVVPVAAQEAFDFEIDPEDARRMHQVLDAPALQSGSSQDLVKAYLERINAARVLRQPERELSEINAGLAAVGSRKAALELYNRLAEYHGDRGDLMNALRTRERALELAAESGSTPVQELVQTTQLVLWQTMLIDRGGAQTTLARARQVLQRLRSTPGWARSGDYWQAMVALATAQHEERFGSLAEAEAASRACMASMKTYLANTPTATGGQLYFLVACTGHLVSIQTKVGRLDEAAAVNVEFRELIRDFSKQQSRAAFAQSALNAVVRVEIERGRFDEANSIIDGAIERQQVQGAVESSEFIARFRYQRAVILAIQGQWERADRVFSERRIAMLRNREQAERVGVLAAEWGYVQLQLGQKEKALETLNRIVDSRLARYGSDALFTYEGRGVRAIALGANGRIDEALREFAAVVPRIIELSFAERGSSDSGVFRSTRLNWIFEGYLSLLGQSAVSGSVIVNIDPIDEGFRLADLIRGSTVQRALSIAASRAVIADPDLADLARRYHEQQRSIGSLADGLGNLVARGRVASIDQVVNRIRLDLETLRREQQRVQQEIQRRFPSYAQLIEPQPPRIADVQQLLQPGEVMLSILTGSNQSFVWAIPKFGQARFAIVPVNGKTVAHQVARLRRTLDPSDFGSLRRIPDFDFETAHTIYRQFIEPVAQALDGAESLLVVPHSDLTQLPFSVLVSAPFPAAASRSGFGGYKDASWMAKQLSTSQLPSATSLVALRRDAKAERGERAFIAFGDPVFSRAPQEAPATREPRARSQPLAPSASPDERSGPASMLKLLQPLPETADEVREIAELVGADEARDLFLGVRASERNVKSAELRRYRTVMFATHGLLPGNLPGLSQPALALSDPSLSADGADEDGLLMLDEILALQLRADWVVLSACSTASPDAGSVEAVSGMGRAFFYAGARSLLVTSWPIESESARKLTAAIFRIQRNPSTRSRADALREASLELMRQSTTGGPELSYAHPLFWAPFVLIGDGARGSD